MSTTNNPLPEIFQPQGDVCIPLVVPNDQDFMWYVAKALKQLTLKRWWIQNGSGDEDIVRKEFDARVYQPFIEKLLTQQLCADPEIDNCITYPPNHSDIITYLPQDPFTQRGVTPAGYLLPTFTRYADIFPDLLGSWFQDLLADFSGILTGYEPNDVLTLIGSIVIDGDWDGLLTSGLPRIVLNVTGKGRLLIHFLLVPLGGRAMLSIDVDLNPIDVIEGLLTGGFRMLELNRDFLSTPPELDTTHIEEIEFDEGGEHTVYITFLPVLDDALIPLNYGGGIRAVEWCSFDEDTSMIDCEFIKNCLDTTPDNIALENITLTNLESTTQAFLDDLETQYDGSTPQSIDADIPGSAPGATEKTALCHALGAWLGQYANAKTSKLRAKGQLSQFWNDIQAGIVDAYGGLNNVLGWLVPDNLFACFVSDNEALTALANAQALEDLHCCLYSELENITLLTTSLAGAINACVTSLSGTDAGKIACLIDSDLNTQHELNFYYVYGKSLERQAAGTVFDCPCVAVPPEWAYELDLTQPLPAWVQILNGTWVEGEGVHSVAAGLGPSASINVQLNLNEAYSQLQVAVSYERSSDGSFSDWFRVTGFNGSLSNGRTDWLTHVEPIHGYEAVTYCNPIPGIASGARTNWIFQWIDYQQAQNVMLAKTIKIWRGDGGAMPSPLINNSTPGWYPGCT